METRDKCIKIYNGHRIPSNGDPFRPGFVRRLQANAATHASHRPVEHVPDCRLPYETLEAAATRCGVTWADMRNLFEQGKVRWELNCEKWRYEIVGEIPSKLKIDCYDNPGVLGWIGNFIIGKYYGEGFFVSVIWVLLFLSVMWPFTFVGLLIEHAAKGEASLIGQSGQYDTGGGGFFDEISSRRREDLHWMLGIGKYAGRGY